MHINLHILTLFCCMLLSRGFITAKLSKKRAQLITAKGRLVRMSSLEDSNAENEGSEEVTTLRKKTANA